MKRRLVAGVVVVIIAGAMLPVLVAAPAAAATFPTGLADTVVADGLGAPTGATQLPDGRFLVTSQEGKLWIVTNSVPSVALDISTRVCSASEMGLLSVTPDRNFLSTGWVYVYYTARTNDSCALNGNNPGGAKNRVSRFQVSGSTVNPISELILLDNMPEWGGNHNGGDVRAASDGTLFVSVGDGGAGSPVTNPSDLSLPNGKILRITPLGTVPEGNPNGGVSCKTSWGPPGSPKVCGEIWADGLRNPFRLGFDLGSTRFRINDVGAGTWEEVNDAVVGGHYGWPCREGPAVGPSPDVGCREPTTDPVLWYNHSTGCNVETGGAFVPPNVWPGFDDAYLWVDFGCGNLFIAQPGQTGTPPAVLATGMQQTTDLEFFTANGETSLFYTTYANGGQLHRVLGAPTPVDRPPPPTGEFTSLTPARLLDTRPGSPTIDGLFGGGGAVGNNASIDVQVTGRGGVPAAAQVSAVVLNATITEPNNFSYLTVWPTGVSRPTISNLNYGPGQTVPNLVTVAVGSGGQVSVYNNQGSAHVILDVLGYYSSDKGPFGSRFHGVTPFRDFDTRFGTGGVPADKVGQGATLTFDVTGKGGVPDRSDVTAVVMNVTVTEATGDSFVTVYPDDAPRPTASNLNFGPGQTIPNLVTVRVPPSGIVDFYNQLGATHLLADVVGYYDGDKITEAGRFVAVTAFRRSDTRVSSPYPAPGKIPGGHALVVRYPGIGGLPASGIDSVVTNVTVTEPDLFSFITAFPADGPVPLASNLNFNAGQTVPNLVITKISTGPPPPPTPQTPGWIGYYNQQGNTHLIIDVFGYFTDENFTASGAGTAEAGDSPTEAILEPAP